MYFVHSEYTTPPRGPWFESSCGKTVRTTPSIHTAGRGRNLLMQSIISSTKQHWWDVPSRTCTGVPMYCTPAARHRSMHALHMFRQRVDLFFAGHRSRSVPEHGMFIRCVVKHRPRHHAGRQAPPLRVMRLCAFCASIGQPEGPSKRQCNLPRRLCRSCSSGA